jgi:DNA-binding HxlR family transcriptional regulator
MERSATKPGPRSGSTTPTTGKPPPVARMVEDVVGCKWSLSVLACVRHGIARPGAMERAIGGIRTKVLNERLRKLVRFGVLRKLKFAERPPRVEYRLTPFGRRFVAILDRIAALETQRPRD